MSMQHRSANHQKCISLYSTYITVYITVYITEETMLYLRKSGTEDIFEQERITSIVIHFESNELQMLILHSEYYFCNISQKYLPRTSQQIINLHQCPLLRKLRTLTYRK